MSAKKQAKAKRGARKAAKRRGGSKRAAKPARRPAKKAASRRTKRTAARSSRASKAPKRGAKKSASRSAKRRAASRTAKRGAATKRGAGTKRATAAKRPALQLLKRPAPRPPKRAAAAAPKPFAGAAANASVKDLVLFELVRARVAVHAAIQGLTAGSAEQPTAAGKWSSRQMVLHLAYWDHEMLNALEDAYRHDRKPPLTHDDVLRLNPLGVAELSGHDWESAKRLLQLNREKLLEAFQSIPEEPEAVWGEAHAVGWIARMLAHHDRHHAEKLKDARTSRGE